MAPHPQAQQSPLAQQYPQGQYPQGQPYAAPPPPQKRWPIVALVGVVMLIIGAAAGWFLQPVIDDDGSSDGGETLDTAAAPETTVALPRLAHSSGAFSIADPGLGWEVMLDDMTGDNDQIAVIRYAPSVTAYREDDNADGMSIMDLSADPKTPEEWVSPESAPACPVSRPEPITLGGFTGVTTYWGPCPDIDLTSKIVLIAGTLADGSKIGAQVKASTPEVEQTAQAVIESITRP
ncbi:MAG: hypothetical protein ACK5O2_14235 [Microthrixaceae bacterium]